MAKLMTIEFDGYKAFGSRQSLELRPLTVLFGHNSVGKSAALRLAKVIADAARIDSSAMFGSTVLDYGSAALRGANLDEITFNGQKSSGISFSLLWDDLLKFDLTIKEFVSRKTEGVSRFQISLDTVKIEFINVDPERDLFEVSFDNNTAVARIKFDGVVPDITEFPEFIDRELTSLLKRRLVDFGTSVHWLSAVRAQPPRTFLLEPGTSTHIGPDGSGTAQVLRASLINSSLVASDVSEWLSATCQCSLPLASIDGSVFENREYFPFSVTPLGGSGRVAVRDVGEGIAQALPVITMCRLAARRELGENPIVAIEQPELHLHPRAGTALADGLIKCVEDGSPANHIVETHSESFLLAMQIAVLEKRLATADIVVYWVSSEDHGAKLTKIVFDEEGYPSEGWPSGVFRETLEQARRVGELRVGL